MVETAPGNEGKGREKRVSHLLSHSLAMYLVKVERVRGNETAEKILKIILDDFFDLNIFKSEITSLRKCQDISKEILEKELNEEDTGEK